MFNGDKLYMFPSAGSIQVMGFAMAGDGYVIGIDSASRDEAQKIEETLLELGGKVDCWFFTHSHYDHIEGFVEIMRRGKVRVDSVCYAFPSRRPHSARRGKLRCFRGADKGARR